MSYSFEKVCALKKGDIVWECHSIASLQVELLGDPLIEDIGEGEKKVTFTAKVVSDTAGRETREVNYLLNSKYMHYGPNLYAADAYTRTPIAPKPIGMVSSFADHSETCNRQSGGSFCDCGFS